MNNRVSVNNLTKEYLSPTRVVDCENVELVGELLHATQMQAHMEYFPITTFNNGFVLLDFGKELCGGVRIVCRNASNGAIVHVRFGESVGESNACLGYKGANNDHSVRDFIVPLPALSDQEWGKTGFRFVRLDVCGKAEIVGIYAVSYRYHKLPQGKFVCNDILVNNIYDTAAYTVYLNMQEYIFDGIKRDRLIWVGGYATGSFRTYLYVRQMRTCGKNFARSNCSQPHARVDCCNAHLFVLVDMHCLRLFASHRQPSICLGMFALLGADAKFV